MTERLLELFNLFNKKTKHKSQNLKKVHKGRIEEIFYDAKPYERGILIAILKNNGVLEKSLSDIDIKEIDEYTRKYNNAVKELKHILNEFLKLYPDWDEDYNKNNYYKDNDECWLYMDKNLFTRMENASFNVYNIGLEEKNIVEKIKSRVSKSNKDLKNKVVIDNHSLYFDFLGKDDSFYNLVKNVTVDTFPRITMVTDELRLSTFKLNLDSNKEFEKIKKIYLIKYAAKAKEMIDVKNKALKTAISIDEFDSLVDKAYKDKIDKLNSEIYHIKQDFVDSIAMLDKRAKQGASFSIY